MLYYVIAINMEGLDQLSMYAPSSNNEELLLMKFIGFSFAFPVHIFIVLSAQISIHTLLKIINLWSSTTISHTSYVDRSSILHEISCKFMQLEGFSH